MHPYMELTPNILVGTVVIVPRVRKNPFQGVACYPDRIEALEDLFDEEA